MKTTTDFSVSAEKTDNMSEAGSIEPESEAGRNDRRKEPRTPSNDLSEIVMDIYRTPITCLIHNISSTGAMIETTSTSIAERFMLTNHVRNSRVLCRVAWRKGNFLGVRFLTQPRAC